MNRLSKLLYAQCSRQVLRQSIKVWMLVSQHLRRKKGQMRELCANTLIKCQCEMPQPSLDFHNSATPLTVTKVLSQGMCCSQLTSKLNLITIFAADQTTENLLLLEQIQNLKDHGRQPSLNHIDRHNNSYRVHLQHPHRGCLDELVHPSSFHHPEASSLHT